MSDIGKSDELYLLDPDDKLVKMDSNEHHLEYLLSEFPGEEDYDEDFWNVVFEGGWIRVVLKKNSRDGWDLMLHGASLRRMKKLVRDHFLSRIKYGENKVHIEERINAFHHPIHIFYLPQQKEEFYDFVLERIKRKFCPENLNEVQHFNREGTPLDKLNIGHQEVLKQKAAQIDWDWNFVDYDWVHQRPHHEKIIDIIEITQDYKTFPIKICEVFDDVRKLSIGYYAVSETGEPYSFDGPDIYKDPDEAVEVVKDLIYKIINEI